MHAYAAIYHTHCMQLRIFVAVLYTYCLQLATPPSLCMPFCAHSGTWSGRDVGIGIGIWHYRG